MPRYLAAPIALTIIAFVACVDRGTWVQPNPIEDVKFNCVIFNGPTSVQKFDGEVSSRIFTKWFQEDYAVFGERIETPLSATSIGALILTNENNLLVMPICTWTIESGHTYFACQSDAIGKAPMLCVCTESNTAAEFLEQLKRKMSELADIPR